MNEPPPEVRVPLLTGEANDWSVHLYNQERIIASQDRITEALDGLLETQRNMVRFAERLNANMDVLDETLKESSKAMSGFVTQVVKIPIVIVFIGLASWGFYLEKLSEKGWIVIMAVAAFPYLGDGIVAIFKIIRGGNGAAK